jgi:hypothetical protein
MSKVLIITNHWMDRSENKEMTASLFADGKEYTDYTESKRIYAQALLRFYVSISTESSNIYRILNLKNNDDTIPILCSLVQRILDETNFGDEELRGYFKDDIEKSYRDGLEGGIFEALKAVKNNEHLKNLFVPFMVEHNPPLCYYKVNAENDEEYKAISISSFPKNSNLGLVFNDQWTDALINDFTKEGDDVILALHGSTDWKETDPVLGPRKEDSEELSQTKKRKIRIFLFQHEDFDCIAKVLKSNESLPTLWHKLEKEYGASK